MTESQLIIERPDGATVATVIINRPPTNYFNYQMIADLADAYESLAEDGVRAIVLASEGKHFCAGADFSGGEMAGDRSAAAERIYQEAIRLFRASVPVIAAVQGSAVGGGLGLACSADFRTASATTRFHANFSMLGFHQGFGLSESLPAIVGHQRAADMLYTSRRLDGATAQTIGLVDRLVETGQERVAAHDLAAEIAAAAPLAVRAIKQTLRGPLADRVEKILPWELGEQAVLWGTEDSQEAIRANLARERPAFSGR